MSYCVHALFKQPQSLDFIAQLSTLLEVPTHSCEPIDDSDTEHTLDVQFFFETAQQAQALEAFLQSYPCSITSACVDEKSWQSVASCAQPLSIHNRLWIYPHDMEKERCAQPIVKIRQGLAFGTGHHPTTALCLEALVEASPLVGTFLDYGCGTGILALAALRLGAEQAIGVDNDPLALTSAADHALLNDLAPLCTWKHAQDAGCHDLQGSFPYVCANILQGPLVALAPTLIALLAPKGTLMLSGMLTTQVPLILDAYQALTLIRQRERDGWVCLEFYHDA